MDVQLLTLKIIQTLCQEGFLAAFRKCLSQFEPNRSADDFDLMHGTDTGGIEPLWKFKIHSPSARLGPRYEVTQKQELADAVKFLNEDLQNFTFIDLGCRRSRTLLVASKLGFKNMIGVEFVREFVDIARANLAKQKIANAVVLHVDAVDFDFPDSNMVVYL